jgi:hypothetical protein
VLAKQPLQVTPELIRWLAVTPILMVVVGDNAASRKPVMAEAAGTVLAS